MKISLSADHGGVVLKLVLVKHLKSKGYEVNDLGGFDENAQDFFPEEADKVVKEVLSNNCDLGILICGSGIGISMRANRYKGIRAALVHNEFTAVSSKKHNNANIICFGGRVVDGKLACKCLDEFLATEYEAGRHVERLKKLDVPLVKVN